MKKNIKKFEYYWEATLAITIEILALRAYLWVKSVAEMPVKPLHC